MFCVQPPTCKACAIVIATPAISSTNSRPIFDDLQRRHEFDNTIIIVLGDHGEEFQERGQLTHAAVLNDFQGRTLFWMHLPICRRPKFPRPRRPLILISCRRSSPRSGSPKISFLIKADLCSSNQTSRHSCALRKWFSSAALPSPHDPYLHFTVGLCSREYLFSGANGVTERGFGKNDWLGEVRSIALMRRPKCTKSCRTFHSHLENSTDSWNLQSGRAPARASFSFFCHNLPEADARPRSIVSQAIPRHRIFQRRRPSNLVGQKNFSFRNLRVERGIDLRQFCLLLGGQ